MTTKEEPLNGKLGENVTILSTDEVKSACNFYLRYKDNPELLNEEYLFIDVDKEKKNLKDYNEWLFKLAFKDVLEEKEEENDKN